MPPAPAPETAKVSYLPGWPFPIHGPRLRKVADAAALGLVVWRSAKAFRERTQARNTYVVSVADTDDIYPRIHEWISGQVDPALRHSLRAQSRRYVRRPKPNELESPSIAGPGPQPRYVYDDEPDPLDLFYDGEVGIDTHIGGHPVNIAVSRDDRIGKDDGGWSFKLRPDRITFTTRSVEARDAVVTWLGELVERVAPAVPEQHLYIGRPYGDWDRQGSVSRRRLETVILPAGVAERACEALSAFLDREAQHEELGIPWHYGFLFHGPAGTGKTSLAKAIAGHFGLDVYYLPLSDLYADANLISLLARVPPRAMLLLEDIDVTHAATERTEEKSRVSMSGLLNALDGIVTPHGLVTVMTTNHIDALDDALVRSGRVDLRLEIPALDDEQLNRLAELLTGDADCPPLTASDGLTACDVVDAAKPHLGKPEEIAAALADRWGPNRWVGVPKPPLGPVPGWVEANRRD